MTIVLVTCSGVSNTGKLTTQAAQTLMQRWPGRFIWTSVKKSAASLDEEIRGSDEVIVIEGCRDCCATKKLAGTNTGRYRHIITTDLGIEKNGMADVRFDEIETVVKAVTGLLQED
ncbi:putative zinc-binding protein [Methanoregula sp.]|uniref:putative zinc-binding protein n=1 Tax=Methanoregula sp. TaxID=2052170 RepID=UPI0035691576